MIDNTTPGIGHNIEPTYAQLLADLIRGHFPTPPDKPEQDPSEIGELGEREPLKRLKAIQTALGVAVVRATREGVKPFPNAVSIMNLVAIHSDNGSGCCAQGTERLADLLGIDKRTVQRTIRWMVRIGVMRATPRPSRPPLLWLPYHPDVQNVTAFSVLAELVPLDGAVPGRPSNADLVDQNVRHSAPQVDENLRHKSTKPAAQIDETCGTHARAFLKETLKGTPQEATERPPVVPEVVLREAERAQAADQKGVGRGAPPPTAHEKEVKGKGDRLSPASSLFGDQSLDRPGVIVKNGSVIATIFIKTAKGPSSYVRTLTAGDVKRLALSIGLTDVDTIEIASAVFNQWIVNGFAGGHRWEGRFADECQSRVALWRSRPVSSDIPGNEHLQSIHITTPA